MSARLADKIDLGLEEIARICGQLGPLLDKSSAPEVDDIEVFAACGMLHSFYTEIEKILVMVAREWDAHEPASPMWHRELLIQMSESRDTRPPVLSTALLVTLGEFLAFRHMFRNASIVLMRWDKLSPLLARVRETHVQVQQEIGAFVAFLRSR